ncbi:MAG: MmgE/PrpD family protein [Variovorax sp.]|nr:MmgE/PrpD family protein [Variovorax sp.]
MNSSIDTNIPASNLIALHGSQLRFEDLDSETVAAARLRVLDVLGCALGGTRATGCDALVALAREEGGRSDATIVGAGGLRVPAARASMVNAILARSYDYEVMGVLIEGRLIPSHHAATTVMTALALCEARGLGGRELITALVAGDDVAARVLAASGLDFSQGWDGAATYAALGATVTAGQLMGLTPGQMRHALGIVVDQIGGTIQNIWDGATDFKLAQGTAARNAVLAAQLAAGGWTGMEDPLLGRFAFFRQYTAGCSDPDILVRDLGRRFWGEAYFKPYPACMATHVAIEATLEASAREVFAPDAVESVVLRLPAPALANFCAKPFEPRGCPHGDAIFSYRHMVACALLRGGIAQPHYAEKALRDPALRALAQRVDIQALPAGATGAALSLVLRDGRKLEGTATAPSRSPLLQHASVGEIEDKFRRQVAFSGLLDPGDADRLIDGVAMLERMDSLKPLANLLAGTSVKELA